jgi:hypothetical protein
MSGPRSKPMTMSDEHRLIADASKSDHAKRLLDDEVLAAAFKGLEDTYTAAWRATTIEDVSAREKLFLAINIVGKVRDHLTAMVSNGKLAKAELKVLADTAERRKRFGF